MGRVQEYFQQYYPTGQPHMAAMWGTFIIPATKSGLLLYMFRWLHLPKFEAEGSPTSFHPISKGLEKRFKNNDMAQYCDPTQCGEKSAL